MTQQTTLPQEAPVPLAKNMELNLSSEGDVEVSALEDRTVKEDALIVEAARVCCSGVSCINQEEEEELQYFCYSCGGYCHHACCSMVDRKSICIKCKSGV